MLDEPIPMSLPAILVNPKPAGHAHVRPKASTYGGRTAQPATSARRVQGRRARMRKENDALAGNPHAVAPSRHDLPLGPQKPPPVVFPSPLPPWLLPRTRPAPSPALPSSDPGSTEAGKYSMSLKGIRRTLQRRGARAEEVCQRVEDELTSWKKEVRREVIVFPGRREMSSAGGRVVDGYLVGVPGGDRVWAGRDDGSRQAGPAGVEPERVDVVSWSFDRDGFCPAIVEVGRSEGGLTWAIAEGFERYVVHCVARYHGLVTFSKTTRCGTRLTYILVRPGSVMGGRSTRTAGAGGLDSPPTTDMSSVGGSGTDTDLAVFTDGQPESEIGSEVETGWGGGWDSENERAEEAMTRAEEEQETGRQTSRHTRVTAVAESAAEFARPVDHEEVEADVEWSGVESSDDESTSSATESSTWTQDGLGRSGSVLPTISADFASTSNAPSSVYRTELNNARGGCVGGRPSSGLLSCAIEEDEEEDARPMAKMTLEGEVRAASTVQTGMNTKEDSWQGEMEKKETEGDKQGGKRSKEKTKCVKDVKSEKGEQSFFEYVYGRRGMF